MSQTEYIKMTKIKLQCRFMNNFSIFFTKPDDSQLKDVEVHGRKSKIRRDSCT